MCSWHVDNTYVRALAVVGMINPLSETWLNKPVSDGDIIIDGYNVHRTFVDGRFLMNVLLCKAVRKHLSHI